MQIGVLLRDPQNHLTSTSKMPLGKALQMVSNAIEAREQAEKDAAPAPITLSESPLTRRLFAAAGIDEA